MWPRLAASRASARPDQPPITAGVAQRAPRLRLSQTTFPTDFMGVRTGVGAGNGRL